MTVEISNILKYQNRGMIMKKKLKGFTLLELVIVMAIFSVISVGAMAMIRPAMQLFNKTASQEGASADIDNISRYIQDNLKYADRVNVYYGYGQTSVSDMLNTTVTNALPDLVYDESEKKYTKNYIAAKPLEFFKKYYYPKSADDTYFEDKYVKIMEIAQNGIVSIYTYSLKNFQEDTSNKFFNDVISKEYDFDILGVNTDGNINNDLTISVNISYNGVTKGTDGNKRELNQKSNIGICFVNIINRSEFNVIDELTLEDNQTFETDEYFNVENNKITSHPALAYKYFQPDVIDTEKMGNIYIIYTVPEIIIP